MMKIGAQRISCSVFVLPALCLTAVALVSPALAQIAVSANDNKVVNIEASTRS
jgi:hypothetical protein